GACAPAELVLHGYQQNRECVIEDSPADQLGPAEGPRYLPWLTLSVTRRRLGASRLRRSPQSVQQSTHALFRLSLKAGRTPSKKSIAEVLPFRVVFGDQGYLLGPVHIL